MAFDENKYKAMFEQRYGSGSFDSGLSQARDIGRLKVQASVAKQDYTARLKAAQAAAKKAATKKTYNDAIAYWNDPTNKAALQKDGAYRMANNIRNDPNKQAEYKAQGFNISNKSNDFVDAMYAAASNGQFKSEREYNQFSGQLNKDNAPNRKANQDSIQMVINADKAKVAKAKQQANSSNVKKQQEKQQQAKPGKSLWGDLKDIGKLGYNTLNPFDGVSVEQATKNYANRNQSKTFSEIQRGSNRAVDSASFGAMSNLDKKMTGKTPDYLSSRKFGQGGATDFITSGLGYLVPGSAEYKALNSLKAGKALTQFGAKGLGQRLASEGAKGAIVGAGLSIPEVGVKEALNPQDQNWKDNLKYIGTNTALGAVADPLLYGAGKGLGKLFKKPIAPTPPPNQELLGLPAPQLRLNEPQLQLPKPFTNRVPDIPNKSVQINGTPLLSAPREMLQADKLKIEYKKEFQDAVKQQYDYLKNSMGKGVDYGTTGHGLGNLREVNGSFSVSRNPKWYQDFYKTYGRKPNNGELMQLAQDHVKNGFADEVGNLPAFTPKSVQEIDNQINQIQSMIKNMPDQETQLQPILSALNEDRSKIIGDFNQAVGINPSVGKAEQILPSVPISNEPPLSFKTQKAFNTKDNYPLNFTGKMNPKDMAALKSTPKGLEAISKPGKGYTTPQIPSNVVEPPVSSPKLQPVLPKQPGERSFYNTVQNPEKLSPELQQRLNEFDKTYKPMSNQETVDYANKYVKNDMEKAYQFVKNAKKFDPRHITVGHRLIDELQKAGEFSKALDVVERLAEQGTKAGQSIQSYSIYNRLSAEGQLLRAQRHVNKINQDITDPAKQVKLTPQHVEDISQTADSIQKFAGQMDQANNVMKIMENVKKGKIATDSELETVRSFVTDAKKFFGDLSPNLKEPRVKPVKDVRTRDKVVDFMGKKEDIARQELKKIFGRANSMPVDAFYHLSVIGASKIAKGTVKLADFTEEMTKEFGDTVRPYAKQIYNKAVETFNLQSESVTRQRLSEVEKITNKALKDKNLDVDQADTIREFARQVGAMSGDAKIESSMELQTILQDLERPAFGQKLSAAQTIAQLLNPKTIARNAIGNEMFYRVEQMNKLLATPVDIVRSKITGGERTITFRANNQGQYWRNWLTGAKAGWKGVNPMGLTTAYDIGPQAFRSKFNPLTYLEKSLGATLRSFDHAGYMRAYNKTLGELSTLRAINEGLTGTAKKEAIARYIREADDNMMQIADQYGKFATFQDNTALSNALTKVKKGMNKVSTLGATENFGLGDLVLKYPKTPGNLVMRALDYSPVGIIRSATLLNDAVFKAKNPLATKAATLAFTRAIIGTGGFSLLGYALADKGILTSSGNSDYEVASLEKSAGKQPNSVNISALGRFLQSGLNLTAAGTKEGDTFVSYDWAQPISIAIALGTGVNQSVKENGKLSVGGAVKGGFDSATNTVINQSVLKGLNDFLANYPGRTMSDRVGDAGKGIAGSFVPTLFNQVRQIGDNTTRSTYSPNLLSEIKNRAINRVPGLQKQLPPAYDTLGNQKETYQNKGNNLFNVLLNPSFVSKYKPSPEAQFVLDAINKTGDKTLAPRIAQKKLDGKPLTGKQYSEMQRIMGQRVQQGLSGLSGPSYDEATRKAIEKILRDAGKTAREAIRAERGE